MTQLRRLQGDFKRYLFDGDDRVAAALVDAPRLGAQQRLQIYANAYRARLTEVLSGDFPAVREVLREHPFADLCAAYVAAHPSTSFTLREFGAHLPQFIAGRTQVADRESVGELARFEWAFVEAFDSRDASAIGVAELTRLEPAEWPALEIEVHPSVRLIETHFNTVAVWNAIKEQRSVPSSLGMAPAGCLVWRQALTTVFRSIESVECTAWRALAGGSDFSAMCEALLGDLTPDEIPPRAATLLHSWLNDGLISGLRTP